MHTRNHSKITDIYSFLKRISSILVCVLFLERSLCRFSIKPRTQRWKTTHNPSLIPWTLLLPFHRDVTLLAAGGRDWRLSGGGKPGQMKYWEEVRSADYIPAYEQVLSTVLKDSVKAAVDGIKSDCYLCFTCSWSGVALCKKHGREKQQVF